MSQGIAPLKNEPGYYFENSEKTELVEDAQEDWN